MNEVKEESYSGGAFSKSWQQIIFASKNPNVVIVCRSETSRQSIMTASVYLLQINAITQMPKIVCTSGLI